MVVDKPEQDNSSEAILATEPPIQRNTLSLNRTTLNAVKGLDEKSFHTKHGGDIRLFAALLVNKILNHTISETPPQCSLRYLSSSRFFLVKSNETGA